MASTCSVVSFVVSSGVCNCGVGSVTAGVNIGGGSVTAGVNIGGGSVTAGVNIVKEV